MAGKGCTIYLLRHAIAAARGADWPDDAKRPLTAKGAARMREAVAGLAGLDPGITLVLSSPLVRARQTADIVVAGLKPKPTLDILPSLAPGGAPPQVAEALAAIEPTGSIALVGHEPDLGRLAAWLVGAKSPFPFKKGGACRIDLAKWPPAGAGELVWFAMPKMLRALR